MWVRTTSVCIRLTTTSIVYTVWSTTSVWVDSSTSVLYTTKAPLLVVVVLLFEPFTAQDQGYYCVDCHVSNARLTQWQVDVILVE